MLKAIQILTLSFIATGVLSGCSPKIETYKCSNSESSGRDINLVIEGNKAVVSSLSGEELANWSKCKSEQGVDSYVFVQEGCGNKDRMRDVFFNAKAGTLENYDRKTKETVSKFSCIKGPITQSAATPPATAPITAPATNPTTPAPDPSAPASDR